MDGECHFCHGIVTSHEEDHFFLGDHSDHQTFVHRRCAVGHDILEERASTAGRTVEIECPEYGAIETR